MNTYKIKLLILPLSFFVFSSVFLSPLSVSAQSVSLSRDQQLASIASQLQSLTNLLNQLKTSIFGKEAQAQTEVGETVSYTSVSSGNWSDPKIWDRNEVPGANALVTIASGTEVTYDVQSDAPIAEILINGKFQFTRTVNTSLTAGSIVVLPTGVFEAGTESSPIPAHIQIVITLIDLPNIVYAHLHGQSRLQPALHTHGGTIDMHGAVVNKTWTLLASDAGAGSTLLTVVDSVTDWKAGDTIIVTGTSKLASKTGCTVNGNMPFDCFDTASVQVEEHQIASVSGNTITLVRPLKYVHAGTFPRQAAVGLLTRNILITSKDPLGRRGHVHISSGFFVSDATALPQPPANPVTARIGYVEFSHLGRPEAGVYPVHFHRLGNGGGNSYLKGSSIHHSQNLFVRVHTTNFLTIADNVGYDALGHGFTTEDGTEVYNVFDHNLASRTRNNPVKTNPNDPTDMNEGAGFWLNNQRNYVRNNYAGDTDGWGYSIDPITDGARVPKGKVLTLADQSGNPTPPVSLTTLPILEFSGNRAYASYLGGAEIINLEGADTSAISGFISTDTRSSSIVSYVRHILFDSLNVAYVSFYYQRNLGAGQFGRTGEPLLDTIGQQHPRFVRSTVDTGFSYHHFVSALFDSTTIKKNIHRAIIQSVPTVFVFIDSPVKLSLHQTSWPDNTTTQSETYLFDYDGLGKHVKLTPLGTVPADNLTYTPSPRFKENWAGACGPPPLAQRCFQEAAFTGASNEGVPLRMPFFLNAGMRIPLATIFGSNLDSSKHADVIDANGIRWALENEYVAPPQGYSLPRYGKKGASVAYVSDPASIYGSVAVNGNPNFPSPDPLGYRIDVPNGIYHVDLHLIEKWAGISSATRGVGTRVFDVTAEGTTVFKNLDVFKEAGADTPLIKSFDISVSDGQMTLEWPTKNGMVSAIALCPLDYVQNNLCQKDIATPPPIPTPIPTPTSTPTPTPTPTPTSPSSGGGGGGGSGGSTPSPTPTPPSSGGGGGGGGGSGGSTPTPLPMPDIKFFFIKPLYLTLRHPEVAQLQRFLIQKGLLAIGNDTGYFGPLTQEGVRKFQCAENIVCGGSEDTGYGVVGIHTRAKLNEIGSTGSLPTTLPQASLTESQRQALIQQLTEQIKQLQIQLLQLQIKLLQEQINAF